jgi:hypothetical protein
MGVVRICGPYSGVYQQMLPSLVWVVLMTDSYLCVHLKMTATCVGNANHCVKGWSEGQARQGQNLLIRPFVRALKRTLPTRCAMQPATSRQP